MGSHAPSRDQGWANRAHTWLGLAVVPLVMVLAACSSSGPADVESGQGAPQPLGGAMPIGDLDLAEAAVSGTAARRSPRASRSST